MKNDIEIDIMFTLRTTAGAELSTDKFANVKGVIRSPTGEELRLADATAVSGTSRISTLIYDSDKKHTSERDPIPVERLAVNIENGSFTYTRLFEFEKDIQIEKLMRMARLVFEELKPFEISSSISVGGNQVVVFKDFENGHGGIEMDVIGTRAVGILAKDVLAKVGNTELIQRVMEVINEAAKKSLLDDGASGARRS